MWSKRSWAAPEVGAGAAEPVRFTPDNAPAGAGEPVRLTKDQAADLQVKNMPKKSGKINNSSIDNSGGSGIIDTGELESIIKYSDSSEVPEDVKSAIKETISVIPEPLRKRLEEYVPEIILEEGRGYSSFTPNNNIILDKKTATNSILHELGHAWAKMDNMYEDEEFLAVLADGLD